MKERDIAKHADDGPNIPASCHGDCTASLAWSLGYVFVESDFVLKVCGFGFILYSPVY